MRRVNIYLSDKQDDNLDYLSEMLDGKSRSDIMRDAIDEYTEKYKNEINEFLSGMENTEKENHFLREYENNPISFIEDNVKIDTISDGFIPFKLRDVQRKLINNIHNYNELIINHSRQIGMSISTLAYIAHYIIFNKNKNIFIGTVKYSMGVDIINKLVKILDNLPEHIKPSIKDKNKNAFICNGNNVIAKAVSIDDAHRHNFDLVFLDTFAFVERTIADKFINSIQPFNKEHPYKLIIASSPNECNHFYKLWTDAISNYNNLKPLKISYKSIPGMNDEWELNMIKLIGQTAFDREFNCKFTKEGNIAI